MVSPQSKKYKLPGILVCLGFGFVCLFCFSVFLPFCKKLELNIFCFDLVFGCCLALLYVYFDFVWKDVVFLGACPK